MSYQPKNKEDAAAYIQYLTKGEVKDKDLVTKPYGGRVKVDKHTTTHIDHMQTANAMIKHINVTPGLHPIARKIMTTRIYNPGIKDFEVCFTLGLRQDEMKAFENEGIIVCQQYIKKTNIQESVDRFNIDMVAQVAGIKNLNYQKHNPLLTKA